MAIVLAMVEGTCFGLGGAQQQIAQKAFQRCGLGRAWLSHLLSIWQAPTSTNCWGPVRKCNMLPATFVASANTHRFDLLLLPILLDLPSHFLVGLFLQQPPLQQQQEQRNRNAIKMRLQSAAEFLTRTHQRSENVAAIYIPGQIFRK